MPAFRWPVGPPPLVENLGRYFDIRDGVLRLDYAHLSPEASLSNGLGHDMMILAQVFEHIAPNRKLAINGGAEVLVTDALNRAAQPYAGPPQLPQ